MPTSNPRSILIVKLSAIGDVVHTLPLLEVLRKNFPDARIDWLVEEEAAQVIEGHEGMDRMLVSGRKSWQKRLMRKGRRSEAIREILEFLGNLRSVEYDLVIDMQGLFKSGLLTGLSRGRKKIGFTWAREGSTLFLTARPYFVDQYHQHAIERYLKTADILGCRIDTWQGRIPVRKSDEDRVVNLLRKNRLEEKAFVAMNPMARWRTKLWEPRKFARLAERVREDLGLEVVFTGSAADRSAIEEIRSRMRAETINLAGLTGLKELAFLYTRCKVLITTDTGPMHIAAAMNCPVVALFGPTAPWRTGPYGGGHRVIREELECSPCFKKKCSHLSCMKGITVERVFDAVREQASRGPGVLE
jgi:heptosyltransferase-1